MRGFVYEAAGGRVAPETILAGERIVRTIAERNAIPLAILQADIADAARVAGRGVGGDRGAARGSGPTASNTLS